jgi:hypothetical protein
VNEENQAIRKPNCKPIVVHPGPLSVEDLLQHVDPAPDDEIERFVAAIYADRREAAATLPRE